MKKEHKEMSFYKKALFFLIGLTLLVVGINIYSSNYETTTDATVEGRLVTISPRVSGFVTHIYAEEGLEVKKGDLLMEIDYSPYVEKLRKTESELKVARTKLAMAEYDPETGARRTSTFINKIRFPHGFDNYSSKYGEGIDIDPEDDKGFHLKYDKSVLTDPSKEPKKTKKQPQPQLQQQSNSVKTAQNPQNPQNQNQQQQKDEEEEVLDPVQLGQDVKRLEAMVEQLKLDLSYTKIYATQDGTVSNCRISVGEMADIGQGVISIIPTRVWINANFNPVQTESMVIGQPVVVKISKYPARRFKGVVEDIKRSPESEWITPEQDKQQNVPQIPKAKVPVRITFVEDYSDYEITPGMTVTASVKIH